MHPFDSTVLTYANYTSQILGTSEGKSKTKTAKNLKKVQRALKTLGVNFLHFDDQTAENDPAKSGEGVNSGSSCDKEYCRMGCVCDSVTGKYLFCLNYIHNSGGTVLYHVRVRTINIHFIYFFEV